MKNREERDNITQGGGSDGGRIGAEVVAIVVNLEFVGTHH